MYGYFHWNSSYYAVPFNQHGHPESAFWNSLEEGWSCWDNGFLLSGLFGDIYCTHMKFHDTVSIQQSFIPSESQYKGHVWGNTITHFY